MATDVITLSFELSSLTYSGANDVHYSSRVRGVRDISTEVLQDMQSLIGRLACHKFHSRSRAHFLWKPGLTSTLLPAFIYPLVRGTVVPLYGAEWYESRLSFQSICRCSKLIARRNPQAFFYGYSS